MAHFFRRGKSKIYWLASVAAPSAGPTTGELNAGVDLSCEIGAIAGWSLTNARIATPILCDAFTPSIPGEDTVADSSLTFYDDDGGSSAIRTLLPKGTQGYIFLMPYGRVASKKGDLYHVEVGGSNDEWSLGNDPARFIAEFAILDPPEQRVNIPS